MSEYVTYHCTIYNIIHLCITSSHLFNTGKSECILKSYFNLKNEIFILKFINSEYVNQTFGNLITLSYYVGYNWLGINIF